MYACTLKALPDFLLLAAAETAKQCNPINVPAETGRAILPPEHLALLTSKYWGAGGVKLTVGFLDNAPADLQKRILLHMNAWGAYSNVAFVLASNPQVRIARAEDGYWSYLGTDILHIPKAQATMNLQGFTMQTPESEYHRVVRHETGHTLGFPHEHMRKELIQRLDRPKTIAYFLATQGWSAQVTIQQVLTPLSEASIRATPNADQDSIMCYQLPGSITIDGQPIHGGTDIDAQDQKFAGQIYPLPQEPPPPPNPPPNPPPPINGGSMLLKIIALIAAFKAKDWATVFKLIGDIFGGISAGTITEAELVEAEAMLQVAMKAKK